MKIFPSELAAAKLYLQVYSDPKHVSLPHLKIFGGDCNLVNLVDQFFTYTLIYIWGDFGLDMPLMRIHGNFGSVLEEA